MVMRGPDSRKVEEEVFEEDGDVKDEMKRDTGRVALIPLDTPKTGSLFRYG
ncbi:hypothetical protein YC2023_077776 [Brassica napus]